MIMNYNQWFHKYHQYLTGSRDGKITYNDTKWQTINKRYQTLIDLNSQLIDKQPYGVVGNYYGFQQLTDLMDRSNYTFEDLNDSLIQTYQMSLQNAMSKMLVNTHAVVASVKYGDSKNLSMDRYGDFIVDVPYDQLHFGDRDEFIRQKLHKMYETENQYYVPADEFLSDDISSILGFTLMCCVNGYMVSNWSVGIDEKGFRFKIPWNQTADPNFTIYKLDSSKVASAIVSANDIKNEQLIPFTSFQTDMTKWIGCNCIVEISDPKYNKNILIAPNFGCVEKNGFRIIHVQNRTLSDMTNYRSGSVRVRFYVIKYLREVGDVFPAINYYNMMESHIVYDDQYDRIKDSDGNKIVSQDTQTVSGLQVCTPPISVDRRSELSYRTLTNCFDMITRLETLKGVVTDIGKAINAPKSSFTQQYIESYIKNPCESVYQNMTELLEIYMKCAIVTSMIHHDKIQRFESVMKKFRQMADVNPMYADIQKYVFDELYDEGYTQFVSEISSPFSREPFASLRVLSHSYVNYFETNHDTAINRPISEQCFIALRYDRGEGCWLFDTPKLQHFKGIGNTFYVANDLKGNEIYKFFFLYTDTENPAETSIETFEFDQLIDFDLFTKEVDRHIGFVKYWYAENQLMKLTKMLYNDDSNDAKINVLSQILQRKLNGSAFLEYPSEMNYEPSNASSDNLTADEYDARAPFALNFLFYTLQMMYDNKDQLLSYFIHMLIEKEYHPRYADLKVSNIPNELETETVNYSAISLAPYNITSIDQYYCRFPDTSDVTLYTGIPFVVGSDHSVHSMDNPAYRNVLNCYAVMQQHPLLTNNGVDTEYFVQYHDLDGLSHHQYRYVDDASIANKVSLYLCDIYNGISDLVTNYRSIWNQRTKVKHIMYQMGKHRSDINDYVESRGDDFSPESLQTINVCNHFEDAIENDEMHEALNVLYHQISDMYIWTNPVANKSFTLFGIVTAILTTMQKVYDNTGFDLYATARIRRLYLQLKQINENMSLHELEYWATTLDMETMKELHNLYSDNPNVQYTKTLFTTYAEHLQIFVNRILTNVPLIQTSLDDINGSIFESNLQPLADYCDDIVNKYIFDLYMIDQVNIGNVTLQQKPVYGYFSIANSDDHAHIPYLIMTGDSSVLFQIMYEEFEDTYTITRIVPTCQYAFFDGEPLQVSFTICGADGSTIQTLNDVDVTFKKVSSTSTSLPDMQQFIGSQQLRLDTQNVHETFTVDGTDIVNESHAKLHYELLAGNQFMPLENLTEYKHPDIDAVQGPNDVTYLPCDKLNQFGIVSQNNRAEKTMFFKACQVMHLTPSEGVITALGGNYFVGQTLYAYTDDELYVFPMIVTAIDHSIEHGMIEAVVDEYHAKWLRTNDYNVMHKYLSGNVTCTIADDNIRNFLDEFSDAPGIPENLSDMFKYKSHLIYIGSGKVQSGDDQLIINMINHDFNTFTDPELYPVLRMEPDDHSIWDKERKVFEEEIVKTVTKINSQALELRALSYAMQYAKTREEKIQIQIRMEEIDMRITYNQRYIDRMKLYLYQLETPTTWYNVNAYEDALVYINNGRAHISRTFKPNIRDLICDGNIKVRLYDWDAKRWIEEDKYTVEPSIDMNVQIDHYNEYNTNYVETVVGITFEDQTYESKRILIFFSYQDSSDIDIPIIKPMDCEVRFRPVLNAYNQDTFRDLYSNIRIRKHYDAKEIYAIPTDSDEIVIDRYERSGLYTNGSTLRFCDFTLHTNNSDYDISDFDVFIPNPMKDTNITQYKIRIVYNINVISQIDGFEPDREITLICVQNQNDRSFNGVISDITFKGITTDSGIQIIDSSIHPTLNMSKQFICTVLPDTSHTMSGGMIAVTMNANRTVLSNVKNWLKLDDVTYKIIPKQFKLIPKSQMTFSGESYVKLENLYERDTNYTNDMFAYLYDETYHVRYPISRDIDRNENPSVKQIHSNYISISRYASHHIPENGIIDLTGYIPTPLSRDRYEIWVNGRYISDPSQLVILSPTVLQLRNMTSLKNLEVIELVDDVNNSVITQTGTCYVDLDGKMYPSYQMCILKQANICNQKIQYRFGQNTYSDLDTYLPDEIRDAHNVDIEPDIMSYITQTTDPVSYEDMINLPMINGKTLYHETSDSLGFRELNASLILDLFDKTWKRERLNGIIDTVRDLPYRPIDEDVQTLHILSFPDYFEIFITGMSQRIVTLYISELEDGSIDDTTNTLKIMPMIHPHTHIIIDKSFAGKWLHVLGVPAEPIQIPAE